MTDYFYKAFEDKHRGSRSLIAERLKVYLPFIRWVQKIYPAGKAIDLGCGRGEWLELLVSEGFNPTGVDLDEGMLEACKHLGLSVVKSDAVDLLSKTQSNTQLVVSAFHVVEHISFEQLRNLVSEAMRVLKPGGLLILETPNPENIAVSTRNFYIDPTHIRPIPPLLLEFVAEYVGFERVKTLRLQEPKDILSREIIGLTEVINSVSPDFAVIAQKKANSNIMAESQELFDADYGISLDELTIKLDLRLSSMENYAVQAFNIAQQAEVKAQQAEVKAQQAEVKAQETEKHYAVLLNEVYASRSWRLTAPLRLTGNLIKWWLRGTVAWLTFKPGTRPRRLILTALLHCRNWILLRPKLHQFISKRLINSSSIFLKLKALHKANPIPSAMVFSESELPLASRANDIYQELQTRLGKKQKGFK
jgi:O-antigen chain-terminating methyltransferase